MANDLEIDAPHLAEFALRNRDNPQHRQRVSEASEALDLEIRDAQARNKALQAQLAAAKKELSRINQFIHDCQNPMDASECLAHYNNLNQDHSNNS
jgi:septal ring factor EnvC (AmiA/AmiB activator)